MNLTFLRLSHMAAYINTKHIVEIIHKTEGRGRNYFNIYLSYPNFDGFNTPFFGYISSQHNLYKVEEIYNPEDYKIVSEFVRKYTLNSE